MNQQLKSFSTRTPFLFNAITTGMTMGNPVCCTDENSYAYTKKVLKIQRVYLILLDFRSQFPSNAVIENINCNVKRFKSGGSQVKDCFVSLNCSPPDPIWEGWRSYGVEMANPANHGLQLKQSELFTKWKWA
jgi:hypothetical protein